MNKFEAKAFIGKIVEVPCKDKDENDDVMYFASLSIPHKGANDEQKYQYVDCYVGASLKRLFASAYGVQTINDEGRVGHMFSSHIVAVNIAELFFEINDAGYLAGKGILSSLSFG